MAFVYQAVWQLRPDYFRVEAATNVLPLEAAQIIWSHNPTDTAPLPRLPTDEQVSAHSLLAAYDEYRRAVDVIRTKQQQLRELEVKVAKEQKDSDTAMGKSMAQFRTEYASSAESDARQAASAVREFVRTTGVTDTSNIPLGPLSTRYAQLAIEQAQANLELAKSRQKAAEHIVGNLSEFAVGPEREQFLRTYGAQQKIQQELDRLNEHLNTIHGRINEGAWEYYSTNGPRLTYWDFLYFSLGGATAATFGDIAPNHTAIRMAYSAQIVFSMILLSLWLNDLATKRPRRVRSKKIRV